jgi:hypothetical protein
MYQVGDGAQNQETPILAEDYLTLEYLLCHIDPAKQTPRFFWIRMAGMLQAAEKYQIDSIFKWFKREASLSLTWDDYTITADPMLTLSLALRYDLDETARQALRELLKCSVWDITGGPNIDSSLWRRVSILRSQSTQELIDIIHECPDDPYGHDAECLSETGPHVMDWKKRAVRAVVEDPNWSAIVNSVTDDAPEWEVCDCIPLGHVKQKKEVMKLEEEIPDLSELHW